MASCSFCRSNTKHTPAWRSAYWAHIRGLQKPLLKMSFMWLPLSGPISVEKQATLALPLSSPDNHADNFFIFQLPRSTSWFVPRLNSQVFDSLGSLVLAYVPNRKDESFRMSWIAIEDFV